MAIPTPEQRAEEYIGNGDSEFTKEFRRVVAAIIRQEREESAARVERAKSRMQSAVAAADEQAYAHEDPGNASYYDGRSGGLIDALRILDEEMGDE